MPAGMRIFLFAADGWQDNPSALCKPIPDEEVSFLAISRKRKEELVAQYTELIEQSEAIILTEYKGMSVKSMEGLRTKVREVNGSFYVTKNTLLQYALEQADTPVPTDLMQGQLATGFAAQGEVAGLAKTLVDYAKADNHLIVRGGIMGSELLTADQVDSLAKLPSLDELRAQIIGLVSAPARNIASTVASGVRQVVNVLDAYAKKDEAEAEAA
jgi:large subunit ribosomal protein L10